MALCRRVTRSGVVYEAEIYSVSDCVKNIKESKPKPDNIRTPEEKKNYNNHKSEKHFVRLVNTNFNSSAYYVTLTYDEEHLPLTYEEACNILSNYIRRLQRNNPNVAIIAVTGFGKSNGRLHHHLIILGASEDDILNKWKHGSIKRAEHPRKHNFYNGIDCGEDFTGLAVYLHGHTPAEHKGKRWKQTKNLKKPQQEKAKTVLRSYGLNKPPKAPKGFILVESKTSNYYCGYMYFK